MAHAQASHAHPHNHNAFIDPRLSQTLPTQSAGAAQAPPGSPHVAHHPQRVREADLQRSVGPNMPFAAGATDYSRLRPEAVWGLRSAYPISSWTPVGVGIWVGASRDKGGLGLAREARMLEHACVDGPLLLALDDKTLHTTTGITDPPVRFCDPHMLSYE